MLPVLALNVGAPLPADTETLRPPLACGVVDDSAVDRRNSVVSMTPEDPTAGIDGETGGAACASGEPLVLIGGRPDIKHLFRVDVGGRIGA